MDLLCMPMKVVFLCVWVIIGFPAVGLKPKTIKYCCKQLLITNFLRKKPPLLKPDEEVSGGENGISFLLWAVNISSCLLRNFDPWHVGQRGDNFCFLSRLLCSLTHQQPADYPQSKNIHLVSAHFIRLNVV